MDFGTSLRGLPSPVNGSASLKTLYSAAAKYLACWTSLPCRLKASSMHCLAVSWANSLCKEQNQIGTWNHSWTGLRAIASCWSHCCLAEFESQAVEPRGCHQTLAAFYIERKGRLASSDLQCPGDGFCKSLVWSGEEACAKTQACGCLITLRACYLELEPPNSDSNQ